MRKQRTAALVLSLFMLVLILDSRTVFRGALQGVELCLYTVIPSLFPFFVVTGMLTGFLSGIRIPAVGWIFRSCQIPEGCDSLFLLGILGGYPVGARAINDCYRLELLDRKTAGRMLGFCSNCGPSFIFGICAPLFSRPIAGWILWGIQILSALITGLLLPNGPNSCGATQKAKAIPMNVALKQSIITLAQVCGWVVLFRIILTLAHSWVLFRFPVAIQVLVSGILELSNGCVALVNIDNESLRFILCSGILTFGGICVLMQTVSVTEHTGLGSYFPGKWIQTCISLALASIAGPMLFGQKPAIYPALICAGMCMISVATIKSRKKVVAIV